MRAKYGSCDLETKLAMMWSFPSRNRSYALLQTFYEIGIYVPSERLREKMFLDFVSAGNCINLFNHVFE